MGRNIRVRNTAASMYFYCSLVLILKATGTLQRELRYSRSAIMTQKAQVSQVNKLQTIFNLRIPKKDSAKPRSQIFN